MTSNRVAIGDLQLAIRQWIESELRVDGWAIDPPTPTPRVINGVPYAPNTGRMDPVRNISYENVETVKGQAEFNFSFSYRYDKSFRYDQLPLPLAANVLNNLYYKAVLYPADIHPAITKLVTPDRGVDIVAGKMDDNSGDWIIQIAIQFYVTFRGALGDLSGIQPVPTDPTVVVNKLNIGVYRSEIGNFDENRLDRTVLITPPNPISDELGNLLTTEDGKTITTG